MKAEEQRKVEEEKKTEEQIKQGIDEPERLQFVRLQEIEELRRRAETAIEEAGGTEERCREEIREDFLDLDILWKGPGQSHKSLARSYLKHWEKKAKHLEEESTKKGGYGWKKNCLLYTSDAADE